MTKDELEAIKQASGEAKAQWSEAPWDWKCWLTVAFAIGSFMFFVWAGVGMAP